MGDRTPHASGSAFLLIPGDLPLLDLANVLDINLTFCQVADGAPATTSYLLSFRFAYLAILSLLGWKANGRSEFSFYSFRGSDEETERPDRPTFQQQLDARYGTGRYCVIEFPTTDTKVV